VRLESSLPLSTHNQRHHPMSDTFFYHTSNKTSGWTAAPSSSREAVIAAKKPKYVTVLDLDTLVNDETPLEDTLKIRYSGPFYADWDCPDIMEGAASVNRYLDLLSQDYDVNVECVALYATGGRGFHAEIPFAVMSASKAGVMYLPSIYKEIANETFVEFLDLAVYSAKRGRMWRTPNVERETPGKFKVPISLDQMRNMTQALYDELCSEPQPTPERAEPTLAPAFAALFADLKKKVEQKFRERKNKKGDDSAVKRFKGEWPESVLTLMRGENLSKDVGLNKVALQIGILSCALGKTLDQHLEACEGLISTYKGDGHNTRSSVRNELKRMYGYANGNVAYAYSPAAMAHIMDVPQLAKDLRGTAAQVGGDSNPDDLSDLSRGLINGSNGIYSIKEDTLYRETNWHFDSDSVLEITDAETGVSRGFILQSRDSGRPTQEINVDHGTFVSGDKLKGFLASKGAVAPNMDTLKAGRLLALIMQSAKANGQIKALPKEGFNLIGDHMVWCSPSGCWAHNSPDNYRFRACAGGESGNFRSDVMAAPQLKDLASAGDVIDALLAFNLNDFTVAATLGWFVACWHKPLHIALGQSFPILQAYGESGAGKTLLCMQLLRMFYFNEAPKAMNASQGTAYGRRVMFGGATSIPILVDEFKPTRMSIEAARDFRMTIHEMYTPAFQSPRGGGDARSSAPGNWAELSQDTKTTPLCFTTETAESETAIQERTISVPFSKAARGGTADAAFQKLTGNPEVLAAVGKLLLQGTAAAKRDTLKSLIERGHTVAKENLNRSGNSRIVYNAGVAISGLGFLGMVLRHQMPEEFSERFEARLETLRAALLDATNYTTLQAAPEIVKLLRFMITISHQDEADADHNVRLGKEYAYFGKGLDLDLDVDAFYLRYRTAATRRSQVPAFADPDTFLAALGSSSLLKENSPPDSGLINGTNAPRVVRLSAIALEEYKLGAFMA